MTAYEGTQRELDYEDMATMPALRRGKHPRIQAPTPDMPSLWDVHRCLLAARLNRELAAQSRPTDRMYYRRIDHARYWVRQARLWRERTQQKRKLP
jgi:hypothetical protein